LSFSTKPIYVSRNLLVFYYAVATVLGTEGLVLAIYLGRQYTVSFLLTLQAYALVPELLAIGITSLVWKKQNFAKMEFFDDHVKIHIGRHGESRDVPYSKISVGKSFTLTPKPLQKGFLVNVYFRISVKDEPSRSWSLYNGTVNDSGEKYPLYSWLYIKWRKATGDLRET
jgi:hypothetical protein